MLDDINRVHVPHNDPLLVVPKVLIDTGSFFDLIFRATLKKMGIDLNDVKPSLRTLTGFNGLSETILRMIRLPVRACGVTRTVKFAVVNTKAPYHIILGTPQDTLDAGCPVYLPSLCQIPRNRRHNQNSTGGPASGTRPPDRYSQAPTLTVPCQLSLPPIAKVCPQKDEVLEMPVDDADQARMCALAHT